MSFFLLLSGEGWFSSILIEGVRGRFASNKILVFLQLLNRSHSTNLPTIQRVYTSLVQMDADFIERLQSIHLMEEEGEVIKVRSKNHAKILEECSLSLMGRFHTTKPINL